MQRLIHWYTDLEKMLSVIWVRSLDKINVLSASNYKNIDSFDDFIMYDSVTALDKTMEYFHSKELEYEKNWNFVFELLRK